MKNLTVMGIALALFGIILIYASSLQFENNISNNTLHSAIIEPHNTIAVSTYISNATILGSLYYANSTNMTYYLVNSSVFSQISAYLNSSMLLNKSKLQEGSGVYEIIYNNASGVFPSQAISLLKPPNYYYNGTAIFGSGTYYSLFQNTGNRTILVYYSIVQKLQVSINNSILSSTILSLIAALMFLAGICVIGYSVFIKKGEAQKSVVVDANVDELYAKYDKKRMRRTPAKRARKRSAPK